MGCYFGTDDVAACLLLPDKDKPGGDPFHQDATLKTLQKPRLGTGVYGGTGHDRGHLAPNQSFSHHVCGAGQTFTMANMAPQLAKLNRGLWAGLEEQVLFWAVTEGPIYVVTGTVFTTFPADKFQVITSGGVDKDTIVRSNEKLKEGASGVAGRIVKPTGFYKVIFRPARNGEPARAIAFLVPHPREPMTAHFRQFVARVDVVERASGFTFSVPDELKGAGGQQWWLDRKLPNNWKLRANTCPGDSERQGWQPDLSKEDRRAACLLPN